MRWERDLLAFLRRELAPTPTRWRTASRLTIACTFAVALVMALHVPDGEFVLVSLFVVSQGNSGASLEKGRAAPARHAGRRRRSPSSRWS